MNDITFNINGGNNQILPNATQAVQNFYGDKYMEQARQQKSADMSASAEVSRLRVYINNVEALDGYVTKLAGCKTAKELGFLVVDMVNDDRTDVDEEAMVKKEFIDIIQPLTPQVTTGVDNIRKYVNEAWQTRRQQARERRLRDAHAK